MSETPDPWKAFDELLDYMSKPEPQGGQHAGVRKWRIVPSAAKEIKRTVDYCRAADAQTLAEARAEIKRLTQERDAPRTPESVRHAFEETYSGWGHTITDPKAAAWAAWCAAGSRYSQPGTWPVLPRESTCRR